MSASPATLARLRRRVAALERSGGGIVVPFGLAAVDDHLPWDGLPAACVHEVTGAGDTGAATAFAAALAARMARRRGRPVLWLAPKGPRGETLYGAGLAAFGLDPADTLVVAASPADALWALEEALRSPAIGAVVAELPGAVDLTASRRLQLAAEAGGAAGLLLSANAGTSACVTRWTVAGAESAPVAAVPDSVGAARWRVELVRCRGGRPASWLMEWTDDRSATTGGFALAAPLSDRPDPAPRSVVAGDNVVPLALAG